MPRRILAIDDSLTFRKFITKALQQQSGLYEVTLAKDGTEGLALAASGLPELILLDFVLPDLSGDDVCAQLAANPAVAAIPIILMSSSVDAIAETAARYSAVQGTIAKPFTPETLCDSVEQVFAPAMGATGTEAEPETTAAGEGFAGSMGSFSLMNALSTLQRQRMTGILSINHGGRTLRLACRAGLPLGLLEADEKSFLPHRHALQMFGSLWTEMNASFRFESQEVSSTAPVAPVESMLEWAMDSLREIRDEVESAYAWGDSTGVPAFNRSGYERVQRLALTQEEIDFVKQVDARASVLAISERLGWKLETAHQVLFRFLSLEVFDFWPAAILHANR